MTAADDKSEFINRELSWLSFNQRVLDEATAAEVPLLERLRFLAITASNLDEFYMVRVGSLRSAVRRGDSGVDPCGLTPARQLEQISRRTKDMVAAQHRLYVSDLEPALADHGIIRRRSESLSSEQLDLAEALFEERLFNVLSPIAVEDAETFPLLSSRMISVLVQLAPDPDADPTRSRYAVIPFGRADLRFIRLPSGGGFEFILGEDLVERMAHRFFPGEQIEAACVFRIVRNADMSVREEDGTDLLSEMEDVLEERKDSFCTCLQVSDSVTPESLEFLCRLLRISRRDVHSVEGPPGLADFFRLADLPGFDQLRYEAWPGQPSPDIDPGESLFDVIRRRDILLYHPYESFDPVVRFLEEAAADEDVLAIRQTLYRTSRKSPVIEALKRAAESGKNVTAIVELKARFDEARNIEWARQLEIAGVQVVYGVRNLKTHSKACLVVRREPEGIRRYLHFGTGNYNEITAGIYTDVSYLTCNEELGADAITWFNAVTGYSQLLEFNHLDTAPVSLREKLLRLIEIESDRARQGLEGRIDMKLNSLADPEMIRALYRASRAGVRIRLCVRGICCLRPGVPGLSENIHVISIIDRLLEHARIFYFLHGGEHLVFISSADLMSRNLDRRVELLVPILDEEARQKVMGILDLTFRATEKARVITADGGYIAPQKQKTVRLRSQEEFHRRAVEAARAAAESRSSLFTPIEPER